MATSLASANETHEGTLTTFPRALGRYILYEKIASGGMASVHIGRLVGPVGFARTVAIKRMHSQFAHDPEFVSMFLDEARLAARIRHPNVVQTLDVVTLAGELFLIMDFVHGESLWHLIGGAKSRGERIPPDVLATVMAGTLHGLHAAHEAKDERGEALGIVHRDVSPHNVLVGTDGVARVLDFGVAKAFGRLQTTHAGQLKGKFAYMAPEQVHGEVSRASDVYAASVVLWEGLTGKRLFRGSNGAEVLDRVLRGCDEPPSKYTKSLPSALDEVVMCGMSVDPTKRFPTARDMARALESAISPATATKVGDWVEAAAKEKLTERSARIASIEGAAPVQGLGRPTLPSVPHKSVPPHDTPATMAVQSTPSSGPSSSTPSIETPVLIQPRRPWIWAVGGAGLLLAAGVAVAFAHGSSQPSAVASRQEPAVPSPSTPTSSEPSGALAPPPEDTTEESTTGAPPAPTTTHISHLSKGGSTNGRKGSAGVGASATPPPAPTCTVEIVTTYDSDGQPHFKAQKVCKP